MGETERGCEWPYVFKPRWIHEMLLLWRRKQPYELYLDGVTEYTAREVRDKLLRRRCVAWLANHFAPSRAAATMTQNVWASYSHHFRPNDLAAAYLVHLVMCEPLARQAAKLLHTDFAPGMAVGRAQLGNLVAAPGALESFLRTLQQWDVLAVDPRRGGYLVERTLPVPVQSFPLLVWAWWLDTKETRVAPDEFAQLPCWAWVMRESFDAGWQSYAGRLWTQETEGGAPTIFLHPTDTAGFTRSLLNLLSTDGRRGRQLPRHGERADTQAPLLRESILGR